MIASVTNSSHAAVVWALVSVFVCKATSLCAHFWGDVPFATQYLLASVTVRSAAEGKANG